MLMRRAALQQHCHPAQLVAVAKWLAGQAGWLAESGGQHVLLDGVLVVLRRLSRISLLQHASTCWPYLPQ
jgi:hypothetical protein